MEAPVTTGRRKACDFCVTRKIKCDSLGPNCAICTNCVLNGVPCKLTVTSAVSKRTPVRANQPAAAKVAAKTAAKAASLIQGHRIDAVEARLASIESHLERLATLPVTARAPVHHGAPLHAQPPAAHLHLDGDGNGDGATPAWSYLLSHDSPATTGPASAGLLDLPPLSEVLPIVDNYFKNFNNLIPLFDESSFMRVLLDLYSSPTSLSKVPWAAVNILIAINYRIIDGLHMEDPRLASCIRRAESCMADLMTWKKDLLGLQALLGISIVHHGSFNPELSAVLVGSIMRLVRSMGLHLKQNLQGYSPEVALQRCRVFWIAYLIDRDLSLLTGQPYHMLDSEMDLDIPEDRPSDNKGIVFGKNNAHFNVLRGHVQLAYIQGKAFDVAYRQGVQNLTPEQKQAQMFQIEKMLYNVQRCIPEEFQSAECIAQLPPVSSQLVVTFFFRHLECIFRLHSLLSFNATWIGRVMSYLSPAVIQLGEDEIDGDVMRENLTPLPPRWLEFVNYCRQYLSLSLPKTYVDYTLRVRACCTFSSLIILLVNMIEFPDHNFILSDRHLIEIWREKLVELGVNNTAEYADMYNVLEELDRRARGQVKRISHSNSSGSPVSANNLEFGNFGWPTSPDGDL